MNLLTDKWLTVIRRDNSQDTIAPWELTEGYGKNPVTGIEAPRPDLRSALYQLLIGILQTAFMPEDNDEWVKHWKKPPGSGELKQAFQEYEDCFCIDSAKAAFMQDYQMPETTPGNIGFLFISSPGENTIKHNKDFFIKFDENFCMDPYWAAVALFTLQINAPSGGAGYRTGIRGGGPLTTLLIPEEGKIKPTLWEKLWLNILPEEAIKNLSGKYSLKKKQAIFPWMKETKTSEKEGSELFPQEANPLCMYFAMPRRIRLIFSGEPGTCSLTGGQTNNVVKEYTTVNYGNNYSEHWLHPFSPYKYDPKDNEKPPSSMKAQPEGIFYRHWLGIVRERENIRPAHVVAHGYDSRSKKDIIKQIGAGVWVSGYDMDNMKARCWYDATLPVILVDDDIKEDFNAAVECMISVAEKIASNTYSAVKSAWFSSPKNVKGDLSFVKKDFWQQTELDFYTCLNDLATGMRDMAELKKISEAWSRILRNQSESIFDKWVLSENPDGLDMSQVIKSRKTLVNFNIKSAESLKNLAPEI